MNFIPVNNTRTAMTINAANDHAFGMIGLGVMGRNLLLNLTNLHGFDELL